MTEELPGPPDVAQPARPQEAALLDAQATADLSAKVTESWNDFTAALAKVLGDLATGAILEVTVDQAALEGGKPIYEVTTTCPEEGQLRAYAVGNTMLPTSYRLSRAAVGQLVALGWNPPGAGAPKDERFSIALPVDQAGRLAAILTRTLRDVYGAPHPAFLMYTMDTEVAPTEAEPSGEVPSGEVPSGEVPSGEVPGGEQPAVASPPVRLPPLGAARAVADDDEDNDLDLPSQTDLSVLTLPEQVATVLGAILKTAPESLPIDNDGDYGIRSGSAMVFVRVRDDPLLIDVFSPVLTDVAPTQPLFTRLSELTARLPIGRLYWANSTVWASVPVIGRNFQAAHLMLAVQVMTGLADELDDRLHGEFGGKRFFVEADRTAAAGAENSTDDGHTGMYL